MNTTQGKLTKEQVECENALREYEQAHRIWFNTPVSSNQSVSENLRIARDKYVAAVKAAHPNWIVF